MCQSPQDSDTRLDNPAFLYIGRNSTDPPKAAFEGCLYRMQFNNFFPLKMLFQKPASPFVTLMPQNDSAFEHRCGIEETMPSPEPIEAKPFPTIPPNRSRQHLDKQGILTDAVIAGSKREIVKKRYLLMWNAVVNRILPHSEPTRVMFFCNFV